MMTICLIVRLVGLPRWIQVASWVFLGLTVLSTVYLGWHYVVDVIGGIAAGRVGGVDRRHRHRQPGRLAGPAQPGGPGSVLIPRASRSARVTFRASARPPRSGLSTTTPRVISHGLSRTSGFSPYRKCTANRLRYM